MEVRKVKFYEPELNMERVYEVMEYVIKHLTLEEVLKMTREITYDMVAWYSEDEKGVIYNGDYDKEHINQATRLQGQLRSLCDLFGQSVINKRKFDEGYLEKYLDGGYMQNKIADLERQIKELQDELEE